MHSRSFLKSQSGAEGPPPGAQEPLGRGQEGRRTREAPDPLVPYFRLYKAPATEAPNIDLFLLFSSLFPRRRRFEIGAAWRRCPAPCRWEGLLPGVPPHPGTPPGCAVISLPWTMGP